MKKTIVIATIVVAIVVAAVLKTSLCLVNTGEVKELRLFGKPYAVKGEGWYFVNPLSERCRLSVATEKVLETGLNLRTADAQLVTVPVEVNYRFIGDQDSAKHFFDLFKDEEAAVKQYIEPNVRSILGEAAREYTVEELQNRGSKSDIDDQILRQAKDLSKSQSEQIALLKEEVKKLLSGEVASTSVTTETTTPIEETVVETLETSSKIDLRGNLLTALREFFSRDKIVEIVNVSIMDIDFADDYDKAIEEKSTLIAKIQAQKFQFAGSVETARKLFNEAQGEANAILREAENTAEATKQRGKNEAAAILASATAKADGYQELSSNLTPNLVVAKAIEKWGGTFPERILVTEGGQNFLFPLGEEIAK